MNTAYPDIIRMIEARGYHNHRLEDHSAAISRGILRDLCATCEPFNSDFSSGRICEWLDFPSPAGRARKLDLVVAEPDRDHGQPDLTHLRVCIENKSVVTAHRNRTNRYDDLSDLVAVLHKNRPDAILVATVLIGVSEDVLNVPDRVKPFVSSEDFDARVLPRLSSGDRSLWTEFAHAVSHNRASDPAKTVEKFRELAHSSARPHRSRGLRLRVVGAGAHRQRESASHRPRQRVGIDVDGEYQAMLDQICRAYKARWHV